MILLKKLLIFTHPIGLVWLLLSTWVVRKLWLRQWRSLWLPGSAWLVLTLFSCTSLTSWLLKDLEGRYPPLKITEVPTADVIVCLGGCAEPSLTEPTGVNFASSIDRVTTALALLAEKKAPLLIVTGGGYLRDGVWYSESDAVVSYFKTKLSVPLNIISLGHCKDTHDEALKIAALSAEKGWKQIILVTSATHLPRAVATFQKAGLSVTPEPSDFISSYYGIVETSWLHLPQTGSFLGFGSWLHEIIGTWVYRWRGWI